MIPVLHPLVLVLVLGTLGSTTVGVRAWRLRPTPGARGLAVMMGCATLWTAGSICSLLTSSLLGNHLATNAVYAGISFVPVAVLVFSVEITGRRTLLSRRVIGALLVVPLLSQVLIWTNSDLMMVIDGLTTNTYTVEFGRFSVSNAFTTLHIVDRGPWYHVHTWYSYLLVGTGVLGLAYMAVRSHHLFRTQAVLALAAIVPRCS